MAWEISISPDGWNLIYETLQKRGKRWLFTAVNEAKAQLNEPTLKGLYKKIPQDVLVDCAYELIQRVNTCDNGGYNYWIDPDGIYKISIPEWPTYNL